MTEHDTTIIAAPQRTPAYVFRHVVSFEDTNVVGNVYFVRHVAWQGRCREMFLRENAPHVLQRIGIDLVLATLKVSCEYHDEVRAFDEVEVRMRLSYRRAHRIGLGFEYIIQRGDVETIAARGFQEIGCFRPTPEGFLPTPIPLELADALEPYVGEVTL